MLRERFPLDVRFAGCAGDFLARAAHVQTIRSIPRAVLFILDTNWRQRFGFALVLPFDLPTKKRLGNIGKINRAEQNVV
jgi:hypothetical protein